jgi:integrase
MERGKKTAHPGIRRLGPKKFTVRATVRNSNGKGGSRDKTRVVEGTLQDALRVQHELREELLHPTTHAPPPEVRRAAAASPCKTLSAYAPPWIERLLTTRRARPATAERYSRELERFVLPFLGDVPLNEIDGPHLIWWQQQIAALERPRGGLYAHETLQGVWRMLGTLLRDARREKLCATDPTADVRFEVQGEPPKEKEALTAEEVSAILAQTDAEAPDIRVMLWVLVTTGMRFCELSALTWADVDLDAGTMIVRRSQVRKSVAERTKTKRPRLVTLLPVVVELLQEHRRWQVEEQVPGLELGLLFPSKTGEYRYSGVLTAPLARCCKRAGIGKHATSHIGRRTLNNLVRQVAGEVAAREMVGHVTEAMTHRYSVVSLDERRRAQTAALGDLGPARESRAREVPVPDGKAASAAGVLGPVLGPMSDKPTAAGT